MRMIWIILLFTTIPVYSQTEDISLRFQKITIEQGLPHNYVHSVTQDKKGFIWIGTNYGLARYDGYNFKVFHPNPQKPHSITHKPIGLVYADSRGYLWLTVNGGVNRMDLQTERFTGYFSDSSNIYPIGNYFRAIHESRDSNIWIATSNGLFFYNRDMDKFIYALNDKRFKTTDNNTTSLTDDGMGNIWFIIENKVGILNIKTLEVKALGEYASDPKFDSMAFHSVYSFEKGKIWLTSFQNGLINIDYTTRKIEYFLPNTPFISNFHVDKAGNLYAVTNNLTYNLLVCKKGNIPNKQFEAFPLFDSKIYYQPINFLNDRFENVWISSPVGLGKFNFTTGITLFKANNLYPNNISDNKIESIFIDRTDNLWVCPYRKGINKADLRQKPFKAYSRQIKSLNDILSDKNVSSVFVDSKNNIWFSDSNFGVSVYNKTTRKYYRYFLNSNNAVTSIFEDKDGFMWFGTYWDVLFKAKSANIKNLPSDKILYFPQLESFNIIGIRKIINDNAGNIWFATLNGLVEFNRIQKEFIYHSAQFDSLNNFSSFYRTICIDNKQNIWTGSNSGGLCKYDKLKRKFKHYLHYDNDKLSICSNTVYAIYHDKKDYFWIGTGQGMDKFDPKTEVFEHIGLSGELEKRSIFSIIPDTMGNLWLSCDIGIIRYNMASTQITFYGQSDGLQNNEFNTTANFVDNTGEIYYGGSGGLISYLPQEIQTNPIYAKPVITNIRIRNKIISPNDSLNGRVILNKQVWETNKIALYHNEADFTIEFSALHFSAPEKVSYQYKLDGFNPDWVYTDAKRRYASYTGLPPGDYTFILKATNNDGLLCDPKDEVQLYITIIPPFWRTIWFKILLFIIVSTLVLFYIWRRTRVLQSKNIRLNEKVKERTLELQQSNKILEKRSRELEETNAILEERQEEINLQKEEILSQYETLENNNQILLKHQKQIIEQNTELDQHRNKLEFLVEERTKELEKALAKAEESDKLKTSFLTNMSHEIRTPMNAIIGFSSLLKDKELSYKHDDFINIIASNGMTLLALINDILELSSLQTQQISLKPVSNNLFALLSKLQETHILDFEKKKIELRLNLSQIDRDFHTAFDEIRLKQVISNLISNALKFTNSGYVEFGINSISNKIIFYVKDTGIGIDKENETAVFDRFYKIEKNIDQLYRGTGLGLTICKSIVALWDGEIWFESEPGKGTTFFFSHPLFLPTTISLEPQIKAADNEINWTGKNILIAEDEESNYKLLENYLHGTNAKILWAKNGLEALQILNEITVDLVLMDIKMPQMDGIEASKKIKELYPDVPIIAQTAYAFKKEVETILNTGVQNYIAKPIMKSKLLEIMRKYI